MIPSFSYLFIFKLSMEIYMDVIFPTCSSLRNNISKIVQFHIAAVENETWIHFHSFTE